MGSMDMKSDGPEAFERGFIGFKQNIDGVVLQHIIDIAGNTIGRTKGRIITRV